MRRRAFDQIFEDSKSCTVRQGPNEYRSTLSLNRRVDGEFARATHCSLPERHHWFPVKFEWQLLLPNLTPTKDLQARTVATPTKTAVEISLIV